MGGVSRHSGHRGYFLGTLRENCLSRLPLCCLLWGRRSLTELQEMSATKLLLVYSFLSTLALWVISSSVMALYSFCQPLPHSSAMQPSLPSSRLCILNIAKMNYVQTELLTQLLKHVPFAAFPISSGWSLHFPVAQVKPFSINLVPLSHTHTTSNP